MICNLAKDNGLLERFLEAFKSGERFYESFTVEDALKRLECFKCR